MSINQIKSKRKAHERDEWWGRVERKELVFIEEE